MLFLGGSVDDAIHVDLHKMKVFEILSIYFLKNATRLVKPTDTSHYFPALASTSQSGKIVG